MSLNHDASAATSAPARSQVSADEIDASVDRLRQVAVRTPLQLNQRLSRATGAQVWLKREDLQPVRSYKIRGAYNFIAQLDAEGLANGIVCASAGNHAQGVALACQQRGIHGRVFVPGVTPRQKHDRIRSFGGDLVEVVVVGDSYDEAFAAAKLDARRRKATLIPAFDDARTICGQGTLAPEIANQLSPAVGGSAPDVVVLPVGGGGLIAGVATWMKLRSPSTRVVGVEPAGAASMIAALAEGQPVRVALVDSFVDGAAVSEVGGLTYSIVRDAGVDMVAVDEGSVCTEMLRLHESDGIIVEPAGALASAGLMAGVEIMPGSTVVCVVSGGNNDISRYGEVLERSLIHKGLKHYFLVRFPQEPGALRRFLDEVLGPTDDITLFEYVKRSNRETGPALIGVELARPHDLAGLLARLRASPLSVERVMPGSTLFQYLL